MNNAAVTSMIIHSGVTRHSPDKLDSHQRPGSRGSSLPYPATKLIIGQYLYLSTRPRFWAWLIVGTFYDKDNHKVWSTEIFAIHNDPRGYSPETREFDEGQQPPEHLLHPNTTLHPQNNNNTSFCQYFESFYTPASGSSPCQIFVLALSTGTSSG
ncbi:hypothetical protein HYQ44_004070 [Verticillium longisporum]|nr:hypothetical protein HYQ44_004070 [Verticillium longisporum]